MVGDLSREVRRTRVAMEAAAEARGGAAAEAAAEARCNVLRQELAQKEVEWAERDRFMEGELQEMRSRLSEAREEHARGRAEADAALSTLRCGSSAWHSGTEA